MTIRRSHYEMAFEAYLARRGTPCVAIEDVRHFAKRDTGTKIFDYIVYPPGGTACLVDVKGRKSQSASLDADCRQRTWVTRGDLEGLKAWQEVFGPEYVATFAFAYWLAGDQPLYRPPGDETFVFAGRHYSFWLVSLLDYAAHQKMLSKRWDTVSVPREAFRGISRRLDASWPAAPC